MAEIIYTKIEVIKEIESRVSRSSLRKVAASVGISPAYLSDILRGNRDVSGPVAEMFGFSREVVVSVGFRRKEA
jgi:hypothetical protein